MRTPFLITTDIPTVEEVARELGVSPERTRELVRRADEAFERDQARQAKLKASRKRASNGTAVKKRSG